MGVRRCLEELYGTVAALVADPTFKRSGNMLHDVILGRGCILVENNSKNGAERGQADVLKLCWQTMQADDDNDEGSDVKIE